MVGIGTSTATGKAVYVFLGDDPTGRTLEIGVVNEDGDEIVIHVMPARPRYLAQRQALTEG